jgi:acyl carrier protein
MYSKEKVGEIFLQSAAKAFNKEYDELAANLQLDIHKDMHCESLQVQVILAVIEDDLDIQLDFSDVMQKISTLQSGIDLVYETYKVALER